MIGRRQSLKPLLRLLRAEGVRCNSEGMGEVDGYGFDTAEPEERRSPPTDPPTPPRPGGAENVVEPRGNEASTSARARPTGALAGGEGQGGGGEGSGGEGGTRVAKSSGSVRRRLKQKTANRQNRS